MEKNLKFTIITVTYNAEKWIEQTILSVLSQSYGNIEFIVIDGNSTDGTVGIIRRYAAGIAFWLSEPDSGLYEAMNKGIRHATGDYLWFLNAGDTLPHSDIILRIARLAARRSPLPDIIYGDTAIASAEGKILGKRRLRPPKKLSWRSFRMGMLVCHQSFIVRRETAPLFDLNYRLSADYDWCIRCLREAHSVCNARQILSNFLESGISTRQRKSSLQERYAIMCKYYGKFPTVLLHVWFAIRFYAARLFRTYV